MPRKVKVTISCPDRYNLKVGERCGVHHFKEVDAADFYVGLYGDSQNEFAAREFAYDAFKALLERLKELEERVEQLESEKRVRSGEVD